MRMRGDERGTILIEFVGSFLLFLLLIASILSLINIVTLQARIHYAITETANTLSMYGYVLNVIGVDEHLKNSNAGAASVTDEANNMINEINDVMSGINSLNISGIAGGAGAAGDRVARWTGDIGDDPKGAFQKVLQYGLNEVTNAAFEQLLRPLIEYYLENGDMSGDAYLRSIRVLGDLQFYDFSVVGYTPPAGGEPVGSLTGIADNDSVLLNKDEDVKITVSYEVDYTFFGLQLPFEPKLKITQSVKTKMWLNGSGEGYPRG
jgi:hypothetical protein